MTENTPAIKRPADPVDSAARQKLRMRMILLSFAVSLALMGLKFLTYHITHSSAVLSDALESIINVVASAFAVISIWMAAKPPDPEHPYGHGKIEYFSAGFEGALIVCAAFGIFFTGIAHLRSPHALPHLEKGVLILIGATLINLLLASVCCIPANGPIPSHSPPMAGISLPMSILPVRLWWGLPWSTGPAGSGWTEQLPAWSAFIFSLPALSWFANPLPV